MEFWKVYSLVKARRWMILGLLLITLLTVWIAKKAVDEQNLYTSTAVVLPSTDAYKDQGFFQDNGHGLLSPTYSRFDRMALFTQDIKTQGFKNAISLASQSTIVQKQAILRSLNDKITNGLTARQAKAARKLEDADPAKDPQLETKIDAYLRGAQIPTDDTIWRSRVIPLSVQEQLRASLIAQPIVANDVNTTPGALTPTPVITDYLQIGARATDPLVAEQIANLTAASFINGYNDIGKQTYDHSITTVKKDQHDATERLTQAEDALWNFKKTNPMVDVSSSVSSGVSNLGSLERSRDQAQLQLEVARRSVATYDQLASTTKPTTVVNLDPDANPHAQQLRVEIADAQAQLVALGSRYTPENLKYQDAQQRLEALQGELAGFLKQPFKNATPNGELQALRNLKDAATAEAARAEAAVTQLDAQIADQQAKNTQLPDAEKKLMLLTSAISSAEAEKKAADASAASLLSSHALLDRGQITLAQTADPGIADTSGPTLAALLIYGAILSLILGIAAAIGLDYLDNSVQTIPDAEKLLGMPVSAVIPAMPPGDPRRMTRLTVSDPLSPIAESYRLLRTDMLFTAEEHPFQSLMAATAKPGQGATTTICNLAVALAAVGKRVILIDADLRRPKLHDFFSVSNETGLTSLLRDECELEEALKVTDIDNLLVLPSGPLPLNPAELLASQKMRSLHERLKPHTDFVLVDTPSAIAFSDSSILASYLDAVMIVVRAQETPRGSELQLKNMLNKARANVIGVVLNGVKPQLVDSYFYHAAYYPQITTGNGHANGGVLPPPKNGNGSNGHQHKTLEGDTVGAVVAAAPAEDEDDIESTVVMDDLLTVTPAKSRSRFSLRKMFGTDHRE